MIHKIRISKKTQGWLECPFSSKDAFFSFFDARFNENRISICEASTKHDSIMQTNIFSLFAILTFISSLSLFQACSDNGDVNADILHPNAIVTVKPAGDSFYLQLNETTTLKPENVAKSPYGNREVRAFVNYQDSRQENSTSYSKAVYLNWMDSILTKNTVETQGSSKDIAIYGDDPVWIVADWLTVSEDGYLTIHFRTKRGQNQIKHTVSLITGVNPDNPYEVVLRHDANDDSSDYYADGIIAFRLSSLPDTKGKTVQLTLDWDSFSGMKSADFDYCTRSDE